MEVRNNRRDARFEVDDGITSGDYLQGFLRNPRIKTARGEEAVDDRFSLAK